jgi:hypothetical protein
MIRQNQDRPDRDQNLSNDFLRIENKKLRDEVLERFARYGHDVLHIMLRAVQNRNEMSSIMLRLDIHTPQKVEQQLDFITRYLSEKGLNNFLKKIEVKQKGHLASTVGDSGKSGHAGPFPVKERDGGMDSMGVRQREVKAASPPNHGQQQQLFDTQGNYIGPEQRSGQDRRSGVDRRDAIDAIRKNMRFGGDRRKGIRRKSDRESASQGNWPAGYSQRLRDIILQNL